MAARSLEQIYSELGGIYDPQANLLRQRQGAIPGQIAEEEKGLQAKQESAFGDILGGARRRGLGFSGIPLSEQAKYSATEYMPALARLRQTGREQALSLEEAILGIQERRNQQAQQLRQSDVQQDLAERQFQEGIRQFNENLRAQAEASRRQAAASRAASPTFGGGAPPQPSGSGINEIQQRAYNTFRTIQSMGGDKRGFYIKGMRQTAAQGDPISKLAAQLYYQSIGKPIPFKEFQ